MKMVYVAGPFRASTPWGIECNVRHAEALALEVWRMGAACLCPHANTRYFDGAAPDHIWLEGDIEMLSRCDAIVMTDNYENSTGAKAEREYAIEHNIPVYYGGVWLSMEMLKIFINS